jgi:tight adherence protein C
VALAFAAFYIGMEIRRQERKNAERVEQAISGYLLAPQLELQVPFTQRVLQPILRSLLRRLGALSPQGNLEKLRRNLLIAGSPMRLSPLDFLGLRVLGAALGLLGGTLALTPITHSFIRALLAGAAAAAICSELPTMWLRSKMAARRKDVMLALADAMDILTVCVDAGLGLESAFMRIGQNWSHALAQEFRRSVMEMGVGISWRESMRNLVYRTDVPELSALVAVLLQADQLGFSISDTLHSQADQLRMRRRQRAQEMARSAPLKMLFPMVLFIMPALFAVIIGPAVPVLMESFKGS